MNIQQLAFNPNGHFAQSAKEQDLVSPSTTFSDILKPFPIFAFSPSGIWKCSLFLLFTIL